MNTRVIFLFFFLLPIAAAEPLSYFLGFARGDYAADIQTPPEFLGFETGARHISASELHGYFEYLAKASDRVSLIPYAESHGGLPLYLAVITSPENHGKIEREQARRTRAILAGRRPPQSFSPVVINMGYSIHGNEPSGANAAPLVAYHLAASKDAGTRTMLEEMVILIDPCLNPDGLDRFAHWANRFRGKTPNSDPQHIEHREPAPNGRTNYYNFDLNRDWMLLQHPESRGRLAQLHQWLPNVVLDFHEMGTNSTYFFQPGVPERTHPMTPQVNQDLTARLAEYHAAALDSLGVRYYTRERFDDYYMGKGSTVVDLKGAVGILFEQASSRGHVQETPNGLLTFEETIRNQVATSFSSLRGTLELKSDLLDYQAAFFKDSLESAAREAATVYLVSAPGDPGRLREFARILQGHEIRFHALTRDITTSGGAVFNPVDSLCIPLEQPQYRYLKAIFEEPVSFQENLFYDVSAWSLPLAFDLQVELSADVTLGDELAPDNIGPVPTAPSPDAVAWILDYRDHLAPQALLHLLKDGAAAYVSMAPFEVVTTDGNPRSFPAGSVQLLPEHGGIDRESMISSIEKVRETFSVTLTGASTGLTPTGIDLGSDRFRRLEAPKIAILTRGGINSYRAGEFWHLLDVISHYPATLLDGNFIRRVELEPYSALIIPDGSIQSLEPSFGEKLAEWVADGGILLAQGQSAATVSEWGLASLESVDRAVLNPEENSLPYADAKRLRDLQAVTGTILHARIDPTHPATYGFGDADVPVMVTSNSWWKPTKNPFSTPLRYAEPPLLAGYISSENRALAAGSAGLLVNRHGAGTVVLLRDPANFRAYWQGTRRLIFNAILFGHVMEVPRLAAD